VKAVFEDNQILPFFLEESMSWFFSICGLVSESDKIKLYNLLPHYIYRYESPILSIWGGGIKDTCRLLRLKLNGEEQISFICGTGMKEKDDKFVLMQDDDWQTLLKTKKNIPTTIDGNFVLLIYSQDKIAIIPDRIGTRAFYLTRFNDLIIISTRLDLISKYCKYKNLDLTTFSTLWLLQNQVGDNCIIEKIKKYTSPVIINTKSFVISNENHLWKPKLKEKINREGIILLLQKYCKVEIPSDMILSLGLSGGMDSRFLFALLLASESKFNIHSFGGENSRDINISKRIATEFKINYKIYDEPIPDDINILIKDFKEFILKTSLVMPISEYLQKRYYSHLHNEKKIVIDGGFGEILRNGLYNSIALQWKTFSKSSNINLFFWRIKESKANIFKDEFINTLTKLALIQVENNYLKISDIFYSIYKRKPKTKEDFRFWLDLFSIYTKHLNYCAIEQARTDEEVINFTPFLQPTFLDSVFSLHYKEKNNEKIVRDFIQSNYKNLTNFPLVKNNLQYSYHLKPIIAKFYIKLRSKFLSNEINIRNQELLWKLKAFIFDSRQTSSFRHFEYYNLKNIDAILKSFYSGDYKLTKQINWLITFEIFRQEFLS